ncbi:MAG TPA: fibronectin type III domain-containing protein [Acidimicrobiales bacterium]|nr:fibronectin type III domain-containing protein [Acidimicrobiales bacterium]
MSGTNWRRVSVLVGIAIVLAVVIGAFVVALRSAASVPAAPESVHASAGDANAALTWLAPTSNGGAIIESYTATSAPGGHTCTTSATSCVVKGLANGTSYTFTVVARNSAGAGAASSPSNAVTPRAVLSTCWSLDTSPVVPLAPAVRTVVVQYYTAKHLGPVTFYKDQQWVLNVAEQSKGVHYCKNPDGSKSGYVGAVPANASAAVMVEAFHKPYPVTGSPTHFVTVAQLASGWKVVGEGTGP